MQKYLRLGLSLGLIGCVLGLLGCSQTHFWGAYHPDIKQGQLLSDQVLADLKVGMSQDEVRYLLGSPMLKQIQSDDCWYYPYMLVKKDQVVEQQVIAVCFDAKGYQKFEKRSKSI
jgi:outer membrane protein assembly factor BamE